MRVYGPESRTGTAQASRIWLDPALRLFWDHGAGGLMPIKVDIIFLWLRRSQECRALAEQMKQPEARQKVLATAERYKSMAEQAADRLSREQQANKSVQRAKADGVGVGAEHVRT
jgi:hypothetical protein